MANLPFHKINPEYLFLFALAIRNWYRVEGGFTALGERSDWWRPRPRVRDTNWVEAPAFMAGGQRIVLLFLSFSAGVLAEVFQSALGLPLHAHGVPSSGAGWPGRECGRSRCACPSLRPLANNPSRGRSAIPG